MAIDQNAVIPDRIDPDTVVIDPPAPPRGTFGEIGTGVKRGALVGLPSLIGGALKYVSEPGNTLYDTGQGMVTSAEARGRRTDLSLQPERHGAIVNALASGGEMVAPALAVPVAIGGAAAAAGASPFAATAMAALGGGALFGAEAGQHTLEKGRAARLDEPTAREAARLNAATTVAAQAGMGMIGGQILGTVGRTLATPFMRESATLAERTLADLAGTGGVFKPLAKQLALGSAEAVGVNAGQAAASAQIERSYGVDDVSPGQAAADSVVPTLGLTALMGPLALVTRALNVRAAKTRTESLAHPGTPEAIRTQLADVYADRLAQNDPAAAAAFRTNAQNAIDFKQPLPVDSRLLTPDFITRPNPIADAATERAGQAPTQLGMNPNAGALVVFPDGTTGFASEIEQHLASLPPEQQIIERAKLLGQGQQDVPQPTLRERIEGNQPNPGEITTRMQSERDLRDLHQQVTRGLLDAGVDLAKPLSRDEFGASEQGKGLHGQKLATAYRLYLANPETQRDIMQRDAQAFDALQASKQAEDAAAMQPRNPAPVDTPPAAIAPVNTTMADAMARAIKQRDEEQAAVDTEARKARETDAIANVTKGAQLAADAEAGRVQADPNAPKPREEIEADWHTAMAANDMDTKRQSLVPFMKRLEAMGVDKMDTHAEQIAALDTIAADKKVSQGVRDRASMLAEQWKKEMPAEPKPPVDSSVEKTAETPAGIQTESVKTPEPAEPRPAVGSNAAADAVAGALVGEPPKVALGENIPAKAAPDNAAPSAKLEAAAASLPDNTTPVQKPEPLPAGTPVSDLADAIADKITALRVGFTERLRGGEKLTPLEQERYDDLNAFAQTIARYQEGRAKPSDGEFVKSIGEFVDEAGAPYKKSLRKELTSERATSPNEPAAALNALTSLVHSAEGVMQHLGEYGSQPWVRELANKLQPLMGKTRIERVDEADLNKGQPAGAKPGVADYQFAADNIRVARATEADILHEAVHAATLARLKQAEQIKRPANQQEAALKKAYDDLTGVMNEARQMAGAKDYYGTRDRDVREFVAELHANDQFRAFLNREGFLQRVWDGMRRLLGLPAGGEKLVQRALDASEAFFSNERINQLYDASPEGAAHMTDVSLNRVISDTEARARQVAADAPLKMMRAFLPVQTVSYIANRARAIPELVQSGFTRGLDAFQRANVSHDVILNRLNDVGSKYVANVDRMLRTLDDSKARAVQAEMMTIGGEASRIGFDFRKNGRDNIAADKSIDPNAKAEMDEIHRRFTQLQQTNPDAARLLEEGERINRRSLVEKVATIAANLMDDRAGRVRRLEAELLRMDPTDARRAEKENQVKLLTTESVLASRFAKGLDLMDATLAQGKNADPVRYHDTATANLAGRLHATFDAARALPDGLPLKESLIALESMYAKEARHPYFSLGRDGDFFVKVGFKDIDQGANTRIQEALKGTNKVVGDLTRGDSYAFFRVRTAQEAEALGARLVAAGEGKVVDSAWGRLADRGSLADVASVSPALRTLLSHVDDMPMGNLSREQAETVKMGLTRQLLSMLPETASRNAQMGRRGIPGYDADFLTQFAQRGVGAVHDTAGIYTSRAYMAAGDARKEAIEQLNRTGSADARQRAQLIDDEINQRYANMMRPMGASWVSNLTSLSHSFYLGLSPAFFIRTFVQPWQRGLPFVGSKFGYTSTMGELLSAQGTALKLINNSLQAALSKDGHRGLLGAPLELDGLNLSAPEMGFAREAHANGKLDLGESSQLIRMASAPEHRRLQDAMRYSAVTAQYAEMANRFAIGLAAFRLASKRPQLLAKGMTPEAYALQAMEMAMDDFSPANTARAIGKHGFAGQTTPLFAQFQNYNLQTMQQIARTVHDGFFGQDKSPEGLQRAKEAKREFAGLMATTATIAGALGMPFANAFSGIYNSLMTDKDDPKDVRIAMRQWATTTFGPEMGTVLMKGLPSLLNMDTSTMGQQGILPGSDFLADRTLFKERSEAQVRNALGPAVSLGLDLPGAVVKMMDGYWVKGIEAALPVGLRSMFKTGEMLAGDGYYTDSKGNPVPLKIGASDVAWRALGFQTESKSLQGDAQRDFIINQERLKNRRQIIDDQFLKATRDPSMMPDALSALQGFNAKNPMQPITGQELRSTVSGYHTRFALGAASGTGIPVSRRQFPVLLGDEEHAAMPSR